MFFINLYCVFPKLNYVLTGSAVGDQTTILILASGLVSFQSKKSAFQQTFMITAQGDTWKVVSDVFRFQNAAPS